MFSMPNDVLIQNLRSQLTRLTESAGDLVFTLSDKGEIRHTSQRATGIISPGASLFGMLIYDLVDDADRAGLAATVAQVISTRLYSRFNVRVHTSTGLHWFELEISAHLAADGQVELLAVGRNISGQQETKRSVD